MTTSGGALIDQQVARGVPLSSEVAKVADPILPQQATSALLSHLFDGIYDLRPESHLSRLLGVLLGDAGVGSLRKRLLYGHLTTNLSSAHFYDLDALFADVFGFRRFVSEGLSTDPATELGSMDDWEATLAADASYRNRVEQFVKGVAWCPTPYGIQQVASATVGFPVQVSESYETVDAGLVSSPTVPAGQFTYGELEHYTYSDVEDRAFIDAAAVASPIEVAVPAGTSHAFSGPQLMTDASSVYNGSGDLVYSFTTTPKQDGALVIDTTLSDSGSAYATETIVDPPHFEPGPAVVETVHLSNRDWRYVKQEAHLARFRRKPPPYPALVPGPQVLVGGGSTTRQLSWNSAMRASVSIFSGGDLLANQPYEGKDRVTVRVVADTPLVFTVTIHVDGLPADSYGQPTPPQAPVNVRTLVSSADVNVNPWNPQAPLALIPSRTDFTVRPKRVISKEERYHLVRVLDRLKPVNSRVVVDEQGTPAYVAVPISGSYSPSCYWSIRSEVVPSLESLGSYPAATEADVPVEQPTPVFSEYQGEEWFYNGDVGSIEAYAMDDTGTVQSQDYERAVDQVTGRTVEYPPSNALASEAEVRRGRSVRDGILVSSPFSSDLVLKRRSRALDIFGRPIDTYRSASYRHMREQHGPTFADMRATFPTYADMTSHQAESGTVA